MRTVRARASSGTWSPTCTAPLSYFLSHPPDSILTFSDSELPRLYTTQRYPDLGVMLTYGSLFYAQMFTVSYPSFALLDAKATSLSGVVQHSLATAMGVGRASEPVALYEVAKQPHPQIFSHPCRCSWSTTCGDCALAQ